MIWAAIDLRFPAFLLVVCCALIGIVAHVAGVLKRRRWDRRCAEKTREAKQRRDAANLFNRT